MLTALFTSAVLLVLPSTAIALNLPQALSINSNLTDPITLSTITNLTGHSIRNCVDDPTWNPPSLLISPDCENALLQLEDEGEGVSPRPGKFLYNNGDSIAIFPYSRPSASGYYKEIRLPRRYVSGQCVVAVVMMKMFEDQGIKVPGLPVGKWPVNEEVTWKELVDGGSYVRSTCANGCGYGTVGASDGVLVVVWKLGSWWDQLTWGMGRGGNDVPDKEDQNGESSIRGMKKDLREVE